MSKKTRKKSVGSGVREKRAGKNVKRDGRCLNMSKFDRLCLDPVLHSPRQSDDLWAFHEKDRQDRRGRMKRLQASEARDRDLATKPAQTDRFRTPLLEVVLKDLHSAKILQALFTASNLKFISKPHWPFFVVKRLVKMERPISLEGVVII